MLLVLALAWHPSSTSGSVVCSSERNWQCPTVVLNTPCIEKPEESNPGPSHCEATLLTTRTRCPGLFCFREINKIHCHFSKYCIIIRLTVRRLRVLCERHRTGHFWPPLPAPVSMFPSVQTHKHAHNTCKHITSASHQPREMFRVKRFSDVPIGTWSWSQAPNTLAATSKACSQDREKSKSSNAETGSRLCCCFQWKALLLIFQTY